MTAPDVQQCAKCQRGITDCDECQGTGSIDDEACDVCMGERAGCPVHHSDWRTTETH